MEAHPETRTARTEPFAVVGYADALSVAQGEALHAMVHSPSPYAANLVRLDVTDSPTLITEVGRFPASVQYTRTGSYVEVPSSHALDLGTAFTVSAWVYPTTPTREQALVTKAAPDAIGGWSLSLDADGTLIFEIGGPGDLAVVRGHNPLETRWHFVLAAFDGGAGAVRLASFTPKKRWGKELTDSAEAATTLRTVGRTDASLLIGARYVHERGERRLGAFYNGKIDTPTLLRSASPVTHDFVAEAARSAAHVDDSVLVAQWDFSQNLDSVRVSELSGARLDGLAVNSPGRAVTGHRWDGSTPSFRASPAQYGAIHFHEDDLDDARWTESLTCSLPDDLDSGVYAIEISLDQSSDRIPFFVTPRERSKRPDVAFVAPTLTYMAYGNDHLWSRTDISPGLLWPVERVERPAPADEYLAAHPELGRSLYDEHVDGSGVMYTSFLRPLVNLRDDYRYWQTDAPRHFSADLFLLRWLRRRGIQYDVLTDHVIHDDPLRLNDYRVILTGSHPEYVTEAMLDGIAAFLDRGGRVMYLGGNGFYWVTTIPGDRPHVIEVRRGIAGSRNWTSSPGEEYHSTTAELGGLWRHRGRAPQELFGVGFAAMGHLHAAGYTRTSASYDPEVAFAFDGVRDDVIGEYGRALGGAAGDELDRVDRALGTPDRTRVLATSRGRHDGSFYRCIEDVMQLAPGYDGPSDDAVRADMAYTSYEGGGAVFATGSINWILSLDHNGDDNDVSRITENVLRRFMAH